MDSLRERLERAVNDPGKFASFRSHRGFAEWTVDAILAAIAEHGPDVAGLVEIAETCEGAEDPWQHPIRMAIATITALAARISELEARQSEIADRMVQGIAMASRLPPGRVRDILAAARAK